MPSLPTQSLRFKLKNKQLLFFGGNKSDEEIIKDALARGLDLDNLTLTDLIQRFGPPFSEDNFELKIIEENDNGKTNQ